MKVSNQ